MHLRLGRSNLAQQRPPIANRPTSDSPSTSSVSQPLHGPRISVHALGQFAFCARAGVLASESKDESDHDEGPIRLTYLPNFDLALIEEELFKRMRRGALLLVAIACSFGLLLLALQIAQFWLLQAALVLAIVLAKFLMDVAGAILVLARRRHLAMTAQPLPPLQEISAITAVNWWSLLKSGFEPVNLQAPLQHPELPLEGNPWRVLQYGSLRIPVILSDASQLGPKSATLFPKHQLRLAAYGLLLSAAEHIRVPYGIVLPANSTHGLAIPIDGELTSRAIDFVHRVRGILQQTTSSQLVPALPPSTYCTTCPFGKPEIISQREIVRTRREQQNLLVLTDRNGRYFHCRCGDRFQSAPPHRTITRRQLLALVE